MHTPIDPHTPTPEFRANLEWEISRSYRRAGRTQPSAGTGRRRIPTAVMLVLAFVLGGLVPVVSAQVQDSRQREVLLAAEQMEREIAARALEVARASRAQALRAYEVGQIAREAYDAAEAALERAAAEYALAQARVQEIQATARPPRDDLGAPRVSGRDYVTERLTLEMRSAEAALVAVEARLAEAQRRQRVGTVSAVAVQEARANLLEAQANIQSIANRLELRQRFLGGEITPEDAAREDQRALLVGQLAAVQARLEVAEARLATVREMVDAGRSGQVDLLRAELERAEREAELEELRARIQRGGI